MTKEFKRILVAVDDSNDSKIAFEYAIYRAKLDDCVLEIASILEDNDFNAFNVLTKEYMHEKRDEIEQKISSYKKVAQADGVKEVHTYVNEGNDEAGEIIVKDLIPKIKPDLLIIGSKSKRGVGKYFGSQASYMVKHSPISVLVVK